MSQDKKNDITVFIARRDPSCAECEEDLGRGAWITLDKERRALCLECADLDHLEFLPAGDTALTRRTRRHSTLSAVVVQWSRARKRYERQGLLVEERALAQAERDCLEDSDVRARQRERAADRRAELDAEYVKQFAARVRELFPKLPRGREKVIAEHACRKHSGRVGRSAAAKALEEEVVRLAVIAHIRHAATRYDNLLATGYDRWDARAEVTPMVDEVLAKWEGARP